MKSMGADDTKAAWLGEIVKGSLGDTGLLIVLVVGLFYASKFVFGVVKWIWQFLLRPSVDLSKLGTWSVVTGATDGIGKAMAKQLAKKGQNLVIISRNPERLATTEKELKDANPLINVKTLALDFATIMDTQAQAAVAGVLDGLNIGVLVNNVGISYPHAQYLEEVDPVRLNQLVQLNCAGTAVMTRLVIGGMKERRRGAIVNVSSFAGTVPQQLYVGYGASKAFVDKFSKDLKLEVAEFGIKVQSQIPFFVVSKLQAGKVLDEQSKRRRANFAVPLPDTYARYAVGQIGYDSPVILSPYPIHAFIHSAIGALPRSIVNWKARSMHIGIRRKALKKKQKAK